MVQSLRLGHVFGAGADDDGQFHLPVGFLGPAGDDDGVIRAADGGCCFHEDNGFRRHGGPGFGGMVGIIQTDADEFACACHAWTEPGSGRHNGQRAGINPAQHCNAGI